MANPEFEVGIIGGGPAGSSLAAYLAKANISCIVLEKEKFPRPHVGESLVPASNRILDEIGVLGKVDQAGFPRKYGAAWTSAQNRIYSMDFEGIPEDCKVDIRFDEREMHNNQNHTYHVDRAKFDHILLKHARETGAFVREEALVQKIDLSPQQFPVITYQQNGKSEAVSVRLVVDASGRHTKLGSQLKLKVKDPNFDQIAIHTWFEGYDRGNEANSDFIFIHFLPMTDSWVWQIPISDTITSFGVVTQKNIFKKHKDDRDSFFWKCMDLHPAVSSKLIASKQLKPMKTEGDYSYAMKAFCGDGWALIGDAARFVDPIFSSGVSVALNSARLLFQDIQKFYADEKGPLFKKGHLQSFEKTLFHGTKNWYRFIGLYYRLNVIFTKYVHDERYRLDVLKLLSGDVYDEAYPEVLKKNGALH